MLLVSFQKSGASHGKYYGMTLIACLSCCMIRNTEPASIYESLGTINHHEFRSVFLRILFTSYCLYSEL